MTSQGMKRGFTFNPEGIGAWGDALRRHQLGDGEPLAAMLRRDGEPTPAARDYLAHIAAKAPRAPGRPSAATFGATVDPTSPEAWSTALRLHAKGNRTAMPAMLRDGAPLPPDVRDVLAKIALATAKRPKSAPAEVGSIEYGKRLYARRRAADLIVGLYEDILSQLRLQPKEGRVGPPTARAIELVAEQLSITERRHITESEVRRALRFGQRRK